MNKNNFIQDLYKRRSTFHDPDQAEMMSNLLDTVSSDIYSESQRFIFELIQNADDAASDKENEMLFDFHTDCLIVSHNGRPFDEEDIKAITHAGKGTKESDQSKTGYKGIGFKSVFGQSEKVSVFSDGFNFRFDKKFIKQSFNGAKMPWQIIPVCTNENELPESAKSIVSNGYNVSTVIELKNTNGLQNDLNELLSNGKILLFLRRITKISVSINGEHNFTIEKLIINKEKYFDEISLLKNNKETTQWIVTTFENIPIDKETQDELGKDDKTPDKLKKAEFTNISFAARVEKHRIKALKGEESLIFTYLPTKVIDFEFPFLVNGNFLTNASREAIHEDRFWNQWLFKIIGIKIFDWLELLTFSKYKFQILHLLPSKFNSHQNELKISFDKAFEYSIISKAFILNSDNKLKKASGILIEKTGLSEVNFISTETLINYVNKEKNKQFGFDALINPKIEQERKLNSIGSVTFDLENLEDFFISDIFTSSHKPIDNFELIKYFFEKANKSSNREFHEKLKTIPFIYAKGKKLKSPQTVCFPSIDYETDFGDGVTVIHSKVYPKIESESKIKDWLESLGVKEPSDTAYLENEIIKNIENCINDTNYLTITRFVFNQSRKGKLEQHHYRALQSLRLLTKNNEFIQAQDCFLSDIYEPSLRLERIQEMISYVSEKYKQSGDLFSEWKTFFTKIGVRQTISWVNKTFSRYEISSQYPQYFAAIPSGVPNNAFGIKNDFYSYEMHMMSFIELASDYSFSKQFWRLVFENELPVNSPGSDMGICYYPSSLTSLNGWIIKNLDIFPTSLKKCLKAENVFVNFKEITEICGKYLPVFDCEYIIKDNWLRVIPFKKEIEFSDYLLILLKISEDTNKENSIKKSNLNRIGLIYNQLSNQIPNFSNEKKGQVKEWADENKLLSSTEKFENPKELKWVNISGFSNTSDRLKTIFIPDNCDTESENFEELLSLFGVQVIDSFIPEIKDAETNASLKIQLQIILPYLVALIEKKQYANYTDEYDRISKIIDNAEFYNASEIILSFKNQEEIISGPSLNAYLGDNQLYFKGKWQSQLILYALVPELEKLLEINELIDELKLLLLSTVDDIKDWLNQIGIDYSTIPIEVVEISEIISSTNISVVNSNMTTQNVDLNKLLSEKNITLEQLMQYIENLDADEIEENIGLSSTNHLAQKGKNEENRVARELVHERLIKEGYEFTKGSGENSVINGVFKDGIEYPLVVKSYRNSSYKFNIRPNEWLQLSKDNSMFWVHRGNGKLEYLKLEGLLRANSDFHVQFETSTFSFEGLSKFAEVFRFVKNVHFQLDAPNFSMAKAFKEYQFDKREKGNLETDSDNQELLH